MNDLIFQDNELRTMSSLDFLNGVINPAREVANESKVENSHFLRRVEDELDDLGDTKIFRHPQNHKAIRYYDLTFDQMIIVGMRESKAVRRNVLEKLKELQVGDQAKAPGNLLEALKLAVTQQEQLLELKIENDNLRPAAAVGERAVEAERSVRSVVRTLPGVNIQKVQKVLCSLGYLHKESDEWKVNRNHTHLFKERITVGAKATIKVIATSEGQKLLHQLYNDNQLPMKKGRMPQPSLLGLTGTD
ncbi:MULTISPECIES: hypothetical protein [unclassified Pseudovibrio]|uniref:hypothetical protein n=1 Tax=unclassified Pseudovibrio TaxID=2627060 RepID=UPI0007B23FFB|nr:MULTISPECIES: hypothetical protein [unclassified Pseudovibrio]KZK85737.1 hypothetical protein PsAD46_03328 [Pseudovibrio sp. Ad46]KZL10678.1 hypothetical protein PsAD26_03042 [Pseudovibrio sp. Ad26]